ncbi:protein of unknown function [Caldanaerobius fijiensis DSM 17918]|uniref:Copper amine oxidase N-terminal domain-containing protein n=1 Tax=Caldanaerobius fijiensis DSM 17918 TaxID=1121256 RepID=A0A1M4X793_9THEO|nr:stalk domain-containing protein [Caldanaerobius fijiensis]SHE89321.1 protein of unknown function [Caldanaerobius fijiensis DSM 17918]
MKKSIKNFIAGFLVATIIMAFSSGIAATAMQKIEVKLNTVKIKVNGKPVVADNILYKGTTYVPLRAISTMLDKDVIWDGKTGTVHINDKGSTNTGEIGYSINNPASINTPLIIDYDFLLDKYKAKVTVTDIIRGEEAWKMVENANMFNEPPKDGYEYLLAKIKFELIDAQNAYDLSQASFKLVSEKGKVYDTPLIVAPDPSIDTSLYKGASHEGWVAFQVEKTDLHPVITFGRKYDGSGGIWFKAYK